MTKTIIMPAQPASRGDFVAACLLLSLNKSETISVSRQERCAAEEAADANVLTINMRDHRDTPIHQPEQGKYFYNPTAKTCPMTDILAQQKLLDAALRYQPWIKPTQIADCSGPQSVVKFLGRTSDLPRSSLFMLEQTKSPVEDFILDWFSQGTKMEPDNGILQLMGGIGDFILANINFGLESETYVASRVQHVEGLNGMAALFLPEPGYESALLRYQEEQAPQATLMFWPDLRRGTCVRRSDNCSDEVSLVCFINERNEHSFMHPNIAWCSKSGHMARTRFPLRETLDVKHMMEWIGAHQPLNNTFSQIKTTSSGRKGKVEIKLEPLAQTSRTDAVPAGGSQPEAADGRFCPETEQAAMAV